MSGVYIALIVCGCVLFVAAVAAFVIFSNWGLTVTKYNLSIASAPDEGLKIVHLTELHARNFG